MIRPVATELALFLAPFAVYALFLWVTKSSVFDRGAWPPKVLLALVVASAILMLGSLVVFTHFSGAPPGARYEPAHMENGTFVPGRVVQ